MFYADPPLAGFYQGLEWVNSERCWCMRRQQNRDPEEELYLFMALAG